MHARTACSFLKSFGLDHRCRRCSTHTCGRRSPPAAASRPPSTLPRAAPRVPRALAASANLDPEFSEKFLRFVIEEVIRHHQAARG